MLNTQDQAIKLGAELVALWADYGSTSETQSDLEMRDACKAVRALDLHQVDGVLASPLNYFVLAYLDDENPEDLTFGEMLESIEMSLELVR